MKISKKDIKHFWETNKKKIIIGATAAGGLIITTLIVCKKHSDESSNMIKGFEGDLTFWRTEPSRPIPETEAFRILDIADDSNDGCVTWLDGCKLSDCGKLGEGLIKIERVNPDMMVTMAILGKDKIESF